MKRGPNILKALLRIYSIHLSAILAVWMGMYYPGLDIILAALYLWLLWAEGSQSRQRLNSLWKQVLIALVWQAPGFFLVGSIMSGLDRLTEFAYYFVFILELWQTPVLPLVSLLPVGMIKGIPVYYGLTFLLVPLLAVYYCLPAIVGIGADSAT